MLPADRTIITCNDTDAIQAALPGAAGGLIRARALASRSPRWSDPGGARGVHHAATRSELLATGRVRPDRVTSSTSAFTRAARRCRMKRGCRDRSDARTAEPGILHVGSTIPRKRIDVLLEIADRRAAPLRRTVRLIRAGGPLTAAQRSSLAKLASLRRDRRGAVSRTAAACGALQTGLCVVLPSDREGFGLPVVEAMACGTPVVASAIPALRGDGRRRPVYCHPGGRRAMGRSGERAPAAMHRSDAAARGETGAGRASPPRPVRLEGLCGRNDGSVRPPRRRQEAGLVKVLHLGKFYPPARRHGDDSRTDLRTAPRDTSPNRVLVANHVGERA